MPEATTNMEKRSVVQILQSNISTITGTIAKCASPAWFSQKLQEKAFITGHAASEILSHRSDVEKVLHLMNAVLAKIDTAPAPRQPFEDFLEILREEPALEVLVEKLSELGHPGG